MIRFADHLRLMRFDLPAAAVGSAWLMLWLAPAVEPEARTNPALAALGPGPAIALSAAVALGLTGGYLAMNRAPRAAMTLLLLAVAAALGFGQVSGLLALLVAAGILMHNVIGRYVPALGIVTVGLMWAAGMAITNPTLGFGHPIALAMSHVMGCAVLLHVYNRKRPALGTESGALIGLGWAFWILLGVSLIGHRRATVTVAGDYALIGVGPLIALIGWLALATWMVRRRTPAERLRHAATLWLLIYAASWLLAAGELWPALAIAALALAAHVAERWRRKRLDVSTVTTDYRTA